MEDTVIFQPPQNTNANTPSKDPLDPFTKYENNPPPQNPLPVQQGQPSVSLPSPQSPQSLPVNPIQTPLPAKGDVLPPPPPRPPSFSPGIPLWGKIAGGIVVIVVILIIIIIIVIAREKPASSGKVTLEYWELWENKNTMQQLFTDFHRKYPNITVDVVVEDPKQYSDRLLTRTKTGTGPDVFVYHNSWIPELLPILSPLSTSAITTNEFTQAFYPVAQKDLINQGAIYGIPMEIDTLSLFVNNNILKAAGVQVPTTWEAFNNVSSLTTVKDQNGKIKTAGAALGTYDNVTHASDIVAMMFAQNGANQANFPSTAKNATNALNFYTAFATSSTGGVWDNTLPNSLVAFAQGNAAMCFGYSYDIFTLRVMNPILDFSVYPVPHLPNRSMTIASYWVQGVSLKSKHQKEAMLLMHFLAQKDTEEKLYALESKTRPFGEPYGRVDLADTLKSDPIVYPFIEQAKTAVSTYFSSNTFDDGINAQMNGYLGNAVRSMLANTSADSAIATLSQGVSQILQQYGQQ